MKNAASASVVKIMNKKYGKCIRRALEDIRKHPERKLMMGGPSGWPKDTSHFWTEDENGNIFDRAKETIPSDYVYKGREVDPKAVIEELEDDGISVKRLQEMAGIKERKIILFPDEYYDTLKDHSKTMTIRHGKEQGKYVPNETYKAFSYDGKDFQIDVKIESIETIDNFEKLKSYGVPQSDINKLPTGEPIDVIRFSYLSP